MFNLRDNLPLLYDFYLVAKENGFSAAAEKNYLSQSSLSRNVHILEESLNLSLINRSNKGITLTVDGERLFKELEKNFEGFHISFLNESKDNKVFGEITIGTTRNIADYLLSNYLIKFNKNYPQIKVNVITDNAHNLYDYLDNHKIDILIDYLPYTESTEKYERTVKAIGEFKTCFACSEKFYQLNYNNIKKLEDLKKYDLVIPGSSRRRQLLDEVLQSNNVELVPTVQMPDSKLMVDFVNNSNFIGYFIEDEIFNTGLIKLDLEESMPQNNIGLVYSKYNTNNIVKKFIELIECEEKGF